jgi:uncharacterized protein (TIGR03437 family)
MRGSLLTLVLATVAIAQTPKLDLPTNAFNGLSTNRDGSMLLFSSPLRLKSATEQVAWEKIFSWTASDGVRLFAERKNADFVETSQGMWNGTQPYHLKGTSMSADGQTVALTGQTDCTWGTVCVRSVERWFSTVRLTDGVEREFQGSILLSANGRYALARSSRQFGTDFSPPVTWLDIQTGQSAVSSVLQVVLGGSRPIADDGSVIRRTDNGFELWRPGFDPFRPAEVRTLRGVNPVLLSSDSKVVISVSAAGWSAYDVATEQSSPIDAIPGSTALDVSEDGSVLLAHYGNSLWIWNRNGSRSPSVPLPGRLTEAVLSGDGKIVFAIIDGTRIVRFEVTTRQMTDVVPATAYALTSLMIESAIVRPGTLLRVSKLAESDLGETKLPLPAGPAIAAQFSEQIWPVITESDGETSVQVPPDAPSDGPPSYVHLLLQPAGDASPFQPAWLARFRLAPLKVGADYIEWLLNPNLSESFILAAHSDFRSVVSPSAPVAPGEVIHAYGRHFGPTDPPVPAAQPAPIHTLSRLTGHLQCGVSEERSNVEVLFAGLAPGAAGIYQVDLRLPASLPEPAARLTCRVGDRTVAGWIPTR